MRTFLVAPAFFAAIVALALGGCDFASQIKDGVAHSAAAAASIEKQVGSKPQIGFNIHNGSLTRVTVEFERAPSTSLVELEKISRLAVVSEFKEDPRVLVIAFTFNRP